MIKTKIIKVAKDKQRSGTGFYNSPTYSNSSTNINVDSELSESSTNPVQNAVITNELNQIKADAVSTVSNTDNTLDISKSGNTVTINSKTWKFNENGDLIYDGTIIPNEVVTSILNADTATLETLTVTKAAHFFQLVIDEIKSTKGQILITAANAKLDKVTVRESDGDIFCYWKATDGNKTIYNQFVADDQVICQTFNVGTSSEATQNKFYWYRVYSVGTETIDGELYNYIHLDPNDKDANSNALPAVGDEIALLGNRTNADRQAAIIISAYNNQYLDNAIQAPSIVQYNGINDFNLNTHRLNVISKGYNSFSGNFTTTAGENLENKFMPYFPINAPFYQYDYKMEVPQDTNPIRYNGENDIYSTPTFLNAGKYKFRVFINSASLSSSIEITSYGTTYPSSDLANYSGIGLTSVLGTTGKTMKVGSTTFYEYSATINITANGYYGLNYWENYQIYIPENDESFETNFSKIEQTNTRITTTVNNINGQISTINQTADEIQLRVDETNVKIDTGQITLNGNTTVNGDLNINDSENGFTLIGNNGQTQIKPTSVGSYSDYIVNKTAFNHSFESGAISISLSANLYTYGYYYDVADYSLTVKSGETIKGLLISNVRPYLLNGNYYNGDNKLRTNAFVQYRTDTNEWGIYTTYYNQQTYYKDIYYINDAEITYYIIVYNSNGTAVTTQSFTGTLKNPPQIKGFTYSFTADGTYRISTYCYVKYTWTSAFSFEGLRKTIREFLRLNYNISFSYEGSSSVISNTLGWDGIALQLGGNNSVALTQSGTIFKYNDNILRITDEGMMKYNGLTTSQNFTNHLNHTDTATSQYLTEYSNIFDPRIRNITSAGNIYLNKKDEMIIKTAVGSVSIYMESPSEFKGKRVVIRVHSNPTECTVYGNLIADDGATHSNVPLARVRTYTFISDGTYWYYN